MKHGPCLLTLKKNSGFRNQVPKETSPRLLLGAQDQRLGAEQNQLPCKSTGTSSGNCQETETCMVRPYHTTRKPVKNHYSGHLAGWATPWSAEEMLDRQHARNAHKGLLQKRLEENLCWIIPHAPPTTQSVKGLNWIKLNPFKTFVLTIKSSSRDRAITCVPLPLLLLLLLLQTMYPDKNWFNCFCFFKSETELTASVLKKRSKTHKRLRESFLNRWNRPKRVNFWGSPLFQVTCNNTTENG